MVGDRHDVDIRLQACGHKQCSLENQGLIFSLVLLYYFTLGGYVYNCAQVADPERIQVIQLAFRWHMDGVLKILWQANGV